MPFWVALGNHDYMGNAQAEIEYGERNELWRMPSPYYCFEEPVGRASVAFFVLDTQPLRLGDFVAEAQLRWLDERLSASRAQWKIVVGHHPMLSHGNHGGSSTLRAKIGPLLDTYGVDLYLSGHDHDLQLVDSGGSWLQVVSGAAATRRPTGTGEGTLFACDEFGFAWVEVRESALTVGFVSETGELRYRHTTEKPLHVAARLDARPRAN